MRSSSPTQSGLLETAQRFYSKSYAGDYIGFAILLLTLAFFEFSDPFHQMFTIDDPRIQHPHAEIERTPVRTSKIPRLLLPARSLTLHPQPCFSYTPSESQPYSSSSHP